MKCPQCSAKITNAHFDADYEIYECPGCGSAFEADDLEEAANGTSPRKRAALAKTAPVAKGKKRQAEISEDEEALKAYEAKQFKPVKKVDATTKHRDEITTGQIIEIVADEIEAIAAEGGIKIDRLNAREFFAMNIVRPLRHEAGVSFREREIPHAYCADHE